MRRTMGDKERGSIRWESRWGKMAVVWVIGVCMGWGLSHWMGPWGGRWMGGPRRPEQRMMRALTREVALTADQHAQIQAVIEETGAAIRKQFQETRPKIEALRAASYQKIRVILTPEQVPAFERVVERWEAKIKAREARRTRDSAPAKEARQAK